uniref:Importin subunit alpha n=1 Tax=Chrysotila carterae TaxID=13221 RepID=A0A6S9SZD4_CHRCT
MNKKEECRRGYKKTLDVDEGRRRREAASVQIRKEKKEDSIQKRRKDAAGASAGTRVGALPDPGLRARLDCLPQDKQLLMSSQKDEQLEGTIRFRKLLSIERHPPISEVIEAGVVPRLVQLLQCFADSALVFEAAWALTNVASGTSEHARVVIDNGAVPIFVQLLAHPSTDVREQAMWALGNIAGDSCRCRDLVLSYSALKILLEQASSPDATTTLLRNAVWTISNLCRGKQPPRWELIAPALPVLVHWICTVEDEEVITDACWALSYISEPAERVQALVDAGALPQLARLLGHESQGVQTPALRAIGNVAAGSEAQTQAALACGVLGTPSSGLGALLRSTKKETRKESCWTISNLSATSDAQVAAVCAAGLLPTLIDMIKTEEYEIKKEAAYCIVNVVCNTRSAEVVERVVQLDAIAALCGLLDLPDASLLIAVLDAMESIMRAGSPRGGDAASPNRYAPFVEQCGGFDKLEALQTHPNETVYNKAAQLLEVFFGADDDEEDAELAPAEHAEGYCFNMHA